jgi:hypothetical protein
VSEYGKAKIERRLAHPALNLPSRRATRAQQAKQDVDDETLSKDKKSSGDRQVLAGERFTV